MPSLYKTHYCNYDLGNNNYQTIEWNETVYINGVKISLHPAGHIIGSSQIRVEYKDEVWVVSGDYKTENDGISGEFEPVKCNTFITESLLAYPFITGNRNRKFLTTSSTGSIKIKRMAKQVF